MAETGDAKPLEPHDEIVRGAPGKRRFFRMRPGLAGLVAAAGSVAGAATIAGFGDRLWWALDPFAHFRVQYAAGLFVAAAAMLALRRLRWAAAFVALAAVNIAVVLNACAPAGSSAPEGAPTVRVAIVNVNTDNDRYDLVRDFLRAADADIAVVEEVDAYWMHELEEISDLYPYHVASPRSDNFGLAILTKWPPVSSETRSIGDADVPTAIARVETVGGPLWVVASHPLPPGGRQYTLWRNQQLAATAEFVRGLEGPVVLAGDLNATPWCSRFRQFVSASGLKDSMAGHMPIVTWPVGRPLLRIPIDHCLHTPDIAVVSRRRGPAVGSDHYPIVVDLAFARSEDATEGNVRGAP